MLNRNRLEAVKRVQPIKVETIGMTQIYQQQQCVMPEYGQVQIMPNIKAVNNVTMASIMSSTIKVNYKVTGC